MSNASPFYSPNSLVRKCGHCGNPHIPAAMVRESITHEQDVMAKRLQLADLLDGCPETLWRFFDGLMRPDQHYHMVRSYAIDLCVLPSTLMSRFFRAKLPAPKAYINAIYLWRVFSYQRITVTSWADAANTYDASSPQSLGRTCKLYLGAPPAAISAMFTPDEMWERFVIGELFTPYLATLKGFDPFGTLAAIKVPALAPMVAAARMVGESTPPAYIAGGGGDGRADVERDYVRTAIFGDDRRDLCPCENEIKRPVERNGELYCSDACADEYGEPRVPCVQHGEYGCMRCTDARVSESSPPYMTREYAARMIENNSHGFVTPDLARNLAGAFGLELPKMQSETNRPDEFKGLNVPGKAIGERVEGYAMADLADAIAEHLDPKYSNPCMGRGFRIQIAMMTIKEHITPKVSEGAAPAYGALPELVVWMRTEGGGGGSGHRANEKRPVVCALLGTKEKSVMIDVGTRGATRVRAASVVRFEIHTENVMRSIAQRITDFDRLCAEREHTDTDAVWSLFHQLRAEAIMFAEEIRNAQDRPAAVRESPARSYRAAALESIAAIGENERPQIDELTSSPKLTGVHQGNRYIAIGFIRYEGATKVVDRIDISVKQFEALISSRAEGSVKIRKTLRDWRRMCVREPKPGYAAALIVPGKPEVQRVMLERAEYGAKSIHALIGDWFSVGFHRNRGRKQLVGFVDDSGSHKTHLGYSAVLGPSIYRVRFPIRGPIVIVGHVGDGDTVSLTEDDYKAITLTPFGPFQFEGASSTFQALDRDMQPTGPAEVISSLPGARIEGVPLLEIAS